MYKGKRYFIKTAQAQHQLDYLKIHYTQKWGVINSPWPYLLADWDPTPAKALAIDTNLNSWVISSNHYRWFLNGIFLLDLFQIKLANKQTYLVSVATC